ncbi:MAG: BRO1-like domain-containing protein [Benjaminiella poitrasii]|nr:MAG: BRO1-like domain-containing protein [Benjaminiella poitrasii]
MRMPPPLDFSTHALQTLIHLMLAQSQECVWQKAAMDQLRDGTIARLALQIADFYDLAYTQATHNAIQSVFPTHWYRHMQIKHLHFTAAAQFRKSCECISQDRYGEEIARLQLASDIVRRAFEQIKHASDDTMVAVKNDLRSLQQIIMTNLARAEKDNDVIYLETVPSVSALPMIVKIQMVKAVPPQEVVEPVSLMQENSLLGLPLFQKLVPFAVHQAASVYVDRKERLINEDIVGKLKELTAVYESSMASLNVRQILAQKIRLPNSILNGAEEVRADGGSQSLYEMWEQVQKASAKNGDILEEAFNILDEEHEWDDSLRLKYTRIWTRPESHQLTQQLVAQGTKHQQTLSAAQKADLIVRSKLDTWATIIDVLTLSDEDLENSIPSDNSSLSQAKPLVDDMDHRVQARERLIQTVKKISNGDDISPALLKKAAQLTSKSPLIKIEAAQFEDLFVEELKKYDEFIMKVDEEEERQTKMLRQLNEAFNHQRSDGKREKALQNLSQAYLKYKEIKTNLSEGLKFYYEHAKGLNQFYDTCKDYCYRRKAESEQLIK